DPLFGSDLSQSAARNRSLAGMGLTVPQVLSRVEELLQQLKAEAEAEAETAPFAPNGRCPTLPGNLSLTEVCSPVESIDEPDERFDRRNNTRARSMPSTSPSSALKMEQVCTQNTEADGAFPPHPRLLELFHEARLGMPLRKMFSQQGSTFGLVVDSWRTWRVSPWEEATGWCASFMILAELLLMPLGAFSPLLDHLLSVVLMCFWCLNLLIFLCRSRCRLAGAQLGWLILEVMGLAILVINVASGLYGRVLLRGLQALRALLLPKYLRKLTVTRWVKASLCQCSREVCAIWNILLLLAGGLLCIHWLTALWYSLGTRPRGWAADDLESFSMLKKYEAALEFGLSRLHPSRLPHNLQLKTQPEKILAVFATFAALVLGGIFTSLVTNDISDIRRKQRVKQEAEQQVHEFLLAYPVPLRLEAVLTKYLAKLNSRQRAVSKNQVASHFPAFLFQELCREAFTPLLSKHKFFFWLGEFFTAFSKDLCAALQDRHMVPQELLFAAGSSCGAMVWVAHGQVKYSTTNNDFVSEDFNGFSLLPKKGRATPVSYPDHVKMLNVGDWMCEACLWTPWQYQGQAVAAGGTLLCLDHETVVSLAFKHMEVTSDIAGYARHFLEALQKDPSDFTSVSYEPAGVR
ncbi:unnamed protein product, partial [Effrenium voratum]